MDFEWDPPKEASAFRRHRITKADVEIAFQDDDRLEYLDDRYEYGEERWILVGLSGARLITVVYTEEDDRIRIITAWPATRAERKTYEDAF